MTGITPYAYRVVVLTAAEPTHVLRVGMSFPPRGDVSVSSRTRVDRVYSPVIGSMLSVRSSAIPSSPLIGVYRVRRSLLRVLQSIIIDFVIPCPVCQGDGAEQRASPARRRRVRVDALVIIRCS
jgi:hypothetical protein